MFLFETVILWRGSADAIIVVRGKNVGVKRKGFTTVVVVVVVVVGTKRNSPVIRIVLFTGMCAIKFAVLSDVSAVSARPSNPNRQGFDGKKVITHYISVRRT